MINRYWYSFILLLCFSFIFNLLKSLVCFLFFFLSSFYEMHCIRQPKTIFFLCFSAHYVESAHLFYLFLFFLFCFRYSLNSFHIHIDKVKFIGESVFIEIETSYQNEEKIKRKLFVRLEKVILMWICFFFHWLTSKDNFSTIY